MTDSSSPLIPTVITDVNGKVTTVHKRASNLPTVKKGIPAPGMPLAPKHVVRQAMKDLSSIGIDLRESSTGNQNLFHLANHHPQLLTELTNRLHKAGSEERRIWKYLVGSTPLNNYGRSAFDRTPYHYRMWFTLLPVALDLFESVRLPDSKVRDSYEVDQIKKLVQSIEATERQQGRLADDDSFLRVASIMTVVKVNDIRFTNDYEGLDAQVDFICENFDAIVPLVPELIKRHTTDIEFIERLLTSDASSLNNGLL